MLRPNRKIGLTRRKVLCHCVEMRTLYLDDANIRRRA